MQAEQAPAQVGESGEQCLVIDIGHQWVHDRAADRAREHGRLDLPVQTRVAQQHPIQALHEALERFVFGQQPDDDGIELQGPHQPAVANRHLDYSYQQPISGFRSIAMRLGLLDGRAQPAQFTLSDGEHDLLLGSELVVHSRFCDSHRIGDHLQRGTADAVLSEQIQRGIEDTCPGRAVLDDPQLRVGDGLSCCYHATRVDDRY
jgi:hypothetical protein